MSLKYEPASELLHMTTIGREPNIADSVPNLQPSTPTHEPWTPNPKP